MGVIRKTLSTTFLHVTSFKLFFWLSMVAMISVDVTGSTSMVTGITNTARPGCSSKCGNVTIPYPFGFAQSCYLNQNYHVFCNSSFDPPRPFLLRYFDRRPSSLWRRYMDESVEILSISETQLRIRTKVALECYNSTGHMVSNSRADQVMLGFPSESPFCFSHESNRLTTIGCSAQGKVSPSTLFDDNNLGSTNCNTNCLSEEKVVEGRCDGVGCCQAGTAKGMRVAAVKLLAKKRKSKSLSYDDCSYAFLAEEGTFTFGGLTDFSDPDFVNKTVGHVPVVVDWVIGNNTCEEARKGPEGSFLCQANTVCSSYSVSVIGGYTCSCLPGYQGNPYLSPGCSDIDECAGENNCSHICHNQPGGYSCSCPQDYIGDGSKDGTRCTKKSSQSLTLKLALGISLGFLCLVFAAIWMYVTHKRLKRLKLKQKFFRENGGLLLRDLLSSMNHDDKEKLKIFTLEELSAATKNFSNDQIIGKGGHGIVYKGVLSDNQAVAIKKSKVVDQSQIAEFINEIVILGQINHDNVVKIVGCCLEIQVPMLVYEYVANGTLFEHIHSGNNNGAQSWLDWSNRMRIAVESASALAHLHSDVPTPIVHRDVKSSNILIDENYTAKVSDFGASRLIPLDQSQLSTVVQGTLGYLDPEYFHSGHLTDKSDVYSFGVVLIELLTRQRPISEERDDSERSLSTYFIDSIQSNRLLHILDPQIVEEASAEKLFSIADLIARCLSMKGKDRPTMTQVVVELKAMKNHIPLSSKQKQHPVDYVHHGCHPQDDESDLYPVPIKTRKL